MTSPNEVLPNRRVAIVGRPNVGKSALFNRLARRRLAIVHDEEGVTRDRITCEVIHNDERLEMIDTGGIGFVDGKTQRDVIARGIQVQIEAALEDAALCLFVVDLQVGLHPLDSEVARLLHEAGRRVFLLANKADSPDAELKAGEFEALGFPVFPVSALHNRGTDAVLDEVLRILPPAPPPADIAPLKVAIVGRPNAGKSSLINRIIGEERLLVTDIPGTTRDCVEIPFSIGKGEATRHYVLIDTAGLRQRNKLKTAVDKFARMRMEDSVANADVVILCLDATEGPKGLDKRLAGLIDEHHKGCIILVNKWDLAEDSEVTQRAYGEALMKQLPRMSHVPLMFASALTGFNVRRLLDAVDVVGGEISRTISTGVLNRMLSDTLEKQPPPMVKSKRFKIFYATQVGTRPITIKFFVNQRALLSPTYERYLFNSLRTAFGLEGAPIVFRMDEKAPREPGGRKAPAVPKLSGDPDADLAPTQRQIRRKKSKIRTREEQRVVNKRKKGR